MDIGCCKRAVMKCRKQHEAIEHKYFGGKWPKVKSAPDPTLINWSNLGKGSIERCGRSTFSYLMALLLLIFGFILIIYLLDVQNKAKMDATLCGEQEISMDEAYSRYQVYGNFNF